MSKRNVRSPDCAEVRAQMFLITTNELSEEEARSVHLHLAECSACRAALAEHVKLSAAMFGMLGKGRSRAV